MIPKTHQWQITLYQWLEERTIGDFECGLPGLSFDPSYFSSDDDVYRAWVTFEDLGRKTTFNEGVRLDASHFLLSNIEQGGGVYMKLKSIVEPGSLAWLYNWDYEGNPYHQSEAVARRALAACMVDMAMCYERHVEDEGKHGYLWQDMGSCFATWAYTFYICGGVLDSDTYAAFSEGLKLFFEALESSPITGIQSVMSYPVLIGMWYTSLIWVDEDYEDRAKAKAVEFYNKHWHKAGYTDHGGGFDPSYFGITLKYMVWLAHISGWDFVVDALGKAYELKSYLTYPDEDGFYSPTSFATYNTYGSSEDQHWSFGRDVAASFLTDNAAYLRYGNRNVASWYKPFGLATPDEMLADLEVWTRRANEQENNDKFGTWTRPSERAPELWDERSKHLGIPQLEWAFYPDGFYDIVKTEANYMGHLPCQDEKNGIWKFEDDFIIWKFNGVGGAIHTGPLSWWDLHQGVALPGLSGGSLCAFWCQEMGIGVLGKNRGYAKGADGDTWDNVDSWAVNHVWGCDLAGNRASSARCKDINKIIALDKENGIVDAKGTVFPSAVSYERLFDIREDKIQVSLTTDNSPDQYLGGCLYETLPLWLGDGYLPQGFANTYPNIHYKSEGLWHVLDYLEPSPKECEAVKVERNGYSMLVEFESIQSIHLGPVWYSSHQAKKARIVPLHIDILETGSVRYTISGPYKTALKKV